MSEEERRNTRTRNKQPPLTLGSINRRQFLVGAGGTALALFLEACARAGVKLTNGEQYGEIVPSSEVGPEAIEKVKRSLAQLKVPGRGYKWTRDNDQVPLGTPPMADQRFLGNVLTISRNGVV